MIPRLGLAAAALLASSCSYSEVIHGTTENAARDRVWVMTNVLPQVNGLTVNSVVYRYTVEKEIADPFTVSVQNQNALGSGYIFRETDDWSGLPGSTISKIKPVADIPSAYLGNGSIETTGIGTVSNPYVIYGYRYDTCADPTTDASCPNYKPNYTFVEPVAYDPLKDDAVKSTLEAKELPKEDERVQPAEKPKEKKLETAKKATTSALNTAEAVSQADAFIALNNIPQFAAYQYTLNGGVYKDAVKLIDSKLPDHRGWRANTWSQQSLHNSMIDLQYRHRKDAR